MLLIKSNPYLGSSENVNMSFKVDSGKRSNRSDAKDKDGSSSLLKLRADI